MKREGREKEKERERDVEAGGEKSRKSRVKYCLENCMVIIIATGTYVFRDQEH